MGVGLLIRRITDALLFGPNMDEIRFAALSLDGFGLDNYGACSLVLREEMIAHRASVFDENSVTFMEHREIGVRDANSLPAGYRAPWADRHRLCVAKLARNLDSSTQSAEFGSLLLKPAETSADDNFVEVHVFGPMTIRTFAQVKVRRALTGPDEVILNAVREQLSNSGYNVQLEIS